MRRHIAIIIMILGVLLLSACQPSPQQVQEAMDKTQAVQPTVTIEPTPTSKSHSAPKLTSTAKPTSTPEPTQTPTEIPQSFLKYNGIYLTFDTETWEVISEGALESLKYPECLILTGPSGHGYEPSLIRIVNEYEIINDITFYFQEYRWKDTDEPAFTNVTWGPNQMYAMEVQSAKSGWDCFQDALGLLWQSSLADFKK